MNDNKLQHNISQTKALRPVFRVSVKIELSNVQEISEVFQFHVDWCDISITPKLMFPRETLKNIAHRYHILVAGFLQRLLLADTLK